MEIEPARCECCGLREDCTLDYIREVTAEFGGTWLCGLCAEAVRDELAKGRRKKKAGYGVEDATRAHMAFCRKFRLNPAVGVADGMRQMLRRRSGDMSMPSSAPRKYGRPAGAAQVVDDPSMSPF